MKGVIFDMDGTMVDNMMTHHRAWQSILAGVGLELTLEEVKREIHGINEEIIARLFGDRFTEEEIKRIAYEKEAAYRRIFLPELKLVDGLPDLLETLYQANIPMAIGTAAPPENVDFVLDNLNLRQYFKSVLHAGHVSKGKPDPEIFIKAANGMGLDAPDCLIFEDSPTGAEAANRAGSPAIILTTTHQQAEFSHFPNVVKFIADFRAVNVEEILEGRLR
jgi:beta-phosphoglucomutase family hydrolase